MARFLVQNKFPRLFGAVGYEAEDREIKEEVLSLHEIFRARLVRYVISLGLKSSDAEDIVQETFLALFHHLLNGRPRTNLPGWLFRVAHRQALKRRTTYCSEIFAVEPLDLPATAASPEDEVIFQQQHERLQRIFSLLPETDRLCLQLRSEGLKYREIASVLNISLGSVYNSLERSLNRLR